MNYCNCPTFGVDCQCVLDILYVFFENFIVHFLSPLFFWLFTLYDKVSYLSIIKYDIMSLGDIMKNNLKFLRKSRGYTQVGLQMQTGIEQALLSKFENGERVPPTETLMILADFYGVSIDYILCRTDIPDINK